MVLVRDPESAVSRALVRAEGYRLLGIAFAHPDAELLREELASAPRELAAIAARLGPHVDERLAGVHSRLFSQSTLVSPHEGNYFVSDKGVLMGQLAALYELFGARVGGAERESPDHIGAELEFAALLSVKEALALDAGPARSESLEVTQQARQVFMEEHLGRWTDELGARLSATAEHPFYAALGQALADWVAADVEASGFSVQQKASSSRHALPVIETPADDLACGAAPVG
jgi:DMSO reductase family type II enzyme chaperone